MDALDAGGCIAGDFDSGAGGAGEADHVDQRMAGDGGADGWAVSVHEVEHALGDTGGVQHLGKEDGVEGGDLAGFQDHGAARGERRRDLAGDLVDRPVPGGDEAADADGFLQDHRSAAVFLEPVVLEDSDGRLEVGDAECGLGLHGEPGWGAHFLGDDGSDFGVALLILGGDGAEQLHALGAGGAAEAGEGGVGGAGGAVDVCGAAHGDAAHGFLGRRVDDIEVGAGRGGIDPLAVDVEFRCVAHGFSPQRFGPVLRAWRRQENAQ